MIFVILGTQKFQLNRLLELLDKLKAEGKIQDDIFAQIGNSTYMPKQFKCEKFLDKSEFEQYIKRAKVIITHSGVGSIISSVKEKKPVIVFPRLSKYNEHVDDHQLDIAKTFEKKKFVLCCYDGEDLNELLRKCESYNFSEYKSETKKIIGIIEDFLDGVK